MINSTTPTRPRWTDAPDSTWSNWQMISRIHRLSDLAEIIQLTPEQTRAPEVDQLIRVDIAALFASLIEVPIAPTVSELLSRPVPAAMPAPLSPVSRGDELVTLRRRP